MVVRHGETEQAILKILHQHRVMMLDEVLTIGEPDFTWNELFFAVDHLSRKQLIARSRCGSTYQLTLKYESNREAQV